ncbi:hypothetical protein ACJRO7_002901 [Eucalyptus globulus]|uniref:Uncharacterized protein n=1 Tax=Eucalyptus globulus TaxID=34317 RepID=A0ABD3LZK0_EUCGL
MDPPPARRFGVPISYNYDYQHVHIPGFAGVYIKCSSTIWVDVGLPLLVPHHFVAWYVLLNGELIGPLRGFDGPLGHDDGGEEMVPEVIDP